VSAEQAVANAPGLGIGYRHAAALASHDISPGQSASAAHGAAQ
jgi:hypothetical protein